MAAKPKRKGRRRPVEFVEHPQTARPIDGLREHKPSGIYYRIAEDGKSRVYFKRQGFQGIDYLRRAIFEHECWRAGKDPDETETLIVTKPCRG